MVGNFCLLTGGGGVGYVWFVDAMSVLADMRTGAKAPEME